MRAALYRFTERQPSDGNGPEEFELYDLQEGPREYRNLADSAAHRGLREPMAKTLAAGWLARCCRICERPAG